MMRSFSLEKRKLLLTWVPGTYGVSGSWKKLWSVTPPALMAATPVGAVTTHVLAVCSRT